MRPLPLLLLASLALTACGAGAAADGKRRIAVIPKGTTHEFWKAVHAGATRAARELDVELIWKGPQTENDRDLQISVVQNFITSGVDGIVLMPLDRTALVRPAKEAAGAGIPVVIADSDLEWDGRVSYVATDNHQGGVLAGQELARLLGGEGQVILVRYQVGSESTEQREKGFLSVMAAHQGLQVVSQDQYSGPTVEEALKTAENLLNDHPEVDGIFCPNESSARGMMKALADSGRKQDIVFVGFDSSPTLLAGLQAGNIDALVLQDPVRMGYEAVKTVVAKLDGRPVEPRVDTGVGVATRENMSEPRMAALLSPDLGILDGE